MPEYKVETRPAETGEGYWFKIFEDGECILDCTRKRYDTEQAAKRIAERIIARRPHPHLDLVPQEAAANESWNARRAKADEILANAGIVGPILTQIIWWAIMRLLEKYMQADDTVNMAPIDDYLNKVKLANGLPVTK